MGNFVDNTQKDCCLTETQIWEVDPDFSLEILNPSWEEPFVDGAPFPTTFTQQDAGNVVGWDTDAPDNEIEIWADGFLGVPAYDGDFFVEMNSSFRARMFQRLTVPNGAGVLNWQVAHTARTPGGSGWGDPNTVNSAEVIIALSEDGVAYTDNVVETMVSNAGAWSVYAGTFAKPCGITDAEIAFNALIPTSGGNGNFLDDVRLTYLRFNTYPTKAYQDCCGKWWRDEEKTIELDPSTFTTCNPNCFDDEGGSNTQNTVTAGTNVTVTETMNPDGTINYEISTSDSDDQNLLPFQLVGTVLTATLEDGGTQSIDLASIDTDTDDQNLTTPTLSPAGILTWGIEDGNSVSVDLSSLDTDTDDQRLLLAYGLDPVTNEINSAILTIEDGNSVDLSALLGQDTDVSGVSVSFGADDITVSVTEDGNTVSDTTPLPFTFEPEYEYYVYWGEESGNLGDNAWQWSWGNGDTGIIGLPVGDGVEIIAMGFHADNTASANDDMQVDVYDIQNANAPVFLSRVQMTNSGDGQNDNPHIYTDFRGAPIPVPAGGVIGFRSGNETGNINSARVGVWTRQETGRMIAVMR